MLAYFTYRNFYKNVIRSPIPQDWAKAKFGSVVDSRWYTGEYESRFGYNTIYQTYMNSFQDQNFVNRLNKKGLFNEALVSSLQ